MRTVWRNSSGLNRGTVSSDDFLPAEDIRRIAGRPVTIDDGRGKREVSYNRAGYPTEVKDAFGNVTKVCYNTFNVPVKVIDANGIVTEYKYSDSAKGWKDVLRYWPGDVVYLENINPPRPTSVDRISSKTHKRNALLR